LRYGLDCSVAVRWLVPQIHAKHALRFLGSLREGENTVIAPDVIVVELGHVLRKLVVGKKVTRGRASAFFDQFLNLDLGLVSSLPLAPDALQLALSHSATFYDSLYLALAEREDLPVLTADDRMAKAFAPLGRAVSLVDLPA
jgi:predicted nucleic acid-binding protein